MNGDPQEPRDYPSGVPDDRSDPTYDRRFPVVEYAAAQIKGSPGMWYKATDGAVWAACPDCGTLSPVGHAGAASGNMTPSLVCLGCGFHEYVRLEGWDG